MDKVHTYLKLSSNKTAKIKNRSYLLILGMCLFKCSFYILAFIKLRVEQNKTTAKHK